VAGSNRSSLRPAVLAAALLGGVCLLAAYAALSAGWFVPPATPVVAIALTLLGVVAETFWIEQQRKREIQSMFGAYVDPAVVARLVRNPEAIELGGEKREATVFFSDLAGFTDLSEKLPPEELVKVVNAYLDETSECLMNHGAYVDKYIGDAVMAVFGAPSEHDDHAYAACLAALEAQEVLADINRRYASTGVQLAVRIGINTGEMVVGNLGSRRKKNYTVMGDAVNLASRLEGANKHFGTLILLGAETAKRVEGRLALRPLARLRVKGKLIAVEVHTLHGRLDDLSADERQFLADYREGYDAYVSRDFARAVAALSRADSRMPGDQTTLYLRGQAEHFLHAPLPADWDATVSLESK
jgi:adenylate cyclase